MRGECTKVDYFLRDLIGLMFPIVILAQGICRKIYVIGLGPGEFVWSITYGVD